MESLKYQERGISDEVDINEVMEQTQELLSRILIENKDLTDRIKSGQYGMVIGIDSSGRIPALILSSVIKSYSDLETRFIAGIRHTNEEQNKSYAEQVGSVAYGIKQDLEEKCNQRVLIIDDVVGSGNSILPLCDKLKLYGLEFDIVVLGSSERANAEDIRNDVGNAKKNLGDVKIFFPPEGEFPMIYGKREMSGTNKSNGLIYSTPNDNNHEVIQYSRQKVAEVSRGLIKLIED